jgi:hypothetical protein
VSSATAPRYSETYRVQLAMYIDYTTHVIMLSVRAVAYSVVFDSLDVILAVYIY